MWTIRLEKGQKWVNSWSTVEKSWQWEEITGIIIYKFYISESLFIFNLIKCLTDNDNDENESWQLSSLRVGSKFVTYMSKDLQSKRPQIKSSTLWSKRAQ